MRLLPIFVVSLLAACGQSSTAKDKVRVLLSDPSSATFIDIESNEVATCGSVNGKNLMGAYVGYRPFIVVNETAEIGEAVDPQFAERFFKICPYQAGATYRAQIMNGLKESTKNLNERLK